MLRPQHYIQSPQSLQADTAFWVVLRQVALHSGSAHMALVGLFALMGVFSMAWINIGSVALFAASWHCLRTRQYYLGVVLILLEVIAHAVLSVLAIGWDSGFHYYLLLIVPVVVIGQVTNLAQKLRIIGGLCVAYALLDVASHHTAPWEVLSETTLTTLRLFNTLMFFGVLTYLCHIYMRAITQAEKKLRALATTDPLTHLLNRRSLLEVAEREMDAARSAGDGVAFVMADIDHFKAINDLHGHALGDLVLSRVGDMLQRAVRGIDTVSRWGGEEFLIFMPQASMETALGVAERLREQVCGLEIPEAPRPLRISMTFGVSSLRPGETLDAAVARADTAMYDGKVRGRNRVIQAAA